MYKSRPKSGARTLIALLAALATGAFGACTHRPDRALQARPTAYRVALLVPGPVSDAGWNAAAFEGLELIKRRLEAETALVQTTSPGDFEDAFRDFAGRGFNLIFAHGFEYTDTALTVGRDFPRTIFVVTSGSATAANVASLTFRIEEAAMSKGWWPRGCRRPAWSARSAGSNCRRFG